MKIGVIVGTTRRTRFADQPAAWFMELASSRTDMEFELLDLRHFELPFFDEVASGASAPTQSEAGRRWQEKLAEFDGFVFVTPEYNHSTTGVLKNAIDYLYVEWHDKAAGFISYGLTGGTRAVEHLRLIMGELQVADIRAQVALTLFDDFDGDRSYHDGDGLERRPWWRVTPGRRAGAGAALVSAALLVALPYDAASAALSASTSNSANSWAASNNIFPYSNAVKADTPWVYWLLDETTGTAAAHYPVNTRPGTYAGTYTLTAELVGAAPIVQLVTVQAGDAITVDLVLGQQASLKGLVTLADGVTPAVGIEVRLYLPAQFPGGAYIAFVTTDVNGFYTFEDVSAPTDFVVAAFATHSSVDVLDSQYVASEPGQEKDPGTMIIV